MLEPLPMTQAGLRAQSSSVLRERGNRSRASTVHILALAVSLCLLEMRTSYCPMARVGGQGLSSEIVLFSQISPKQTSSCLVVGAQPQSTLQMLVHCLQKVHHGRWLLKVLIYFSQTRQGGSSRRQECTFSRTPRRTRVE